LREASWLAEVFVLLKLMPLDWLRAHIAEQFEPPDCVDRVFDALAEDDVNAMGTCPIQVLPWQAGHPVPAILENDPPIICVAAFLVAEGCVQAMWTEGEPTRRDGKERGFPHFVCASVCDRDKLPPLLAWWRGRGVDFRMVNGGCRHGRSDTD
jgi:hypothetical protein